MNIFDKLKFNNIELGNLQAVDEMTIVPILGEKRGDVATPEQLQFKNTTTYGTMVFENTDNERPAIVPCNIMIRGKGQDHAMSRSGIVKMGTSQVFDNACCIEEMQGGYLDNNNNEEDVLPITLRRALLQSSANQIKNYSKLWKAIRHWLKGMSTSANKDRYAAHLRYFYDTPAIKEELEDFAAEFEPVCRQIGAVIMFSGVPVGIEIMPTTQHWEAYWKLLIRGCYGAEMLRLKMLGRIGQSSIEMPTLVQGSSPTEIKQQIEQFLQQQRRDVIPILESIDIKSQEMIGASDTLDTTQVNTTSGGGGDLIQQNGISIYLSLIL